MVLVQFALHDCMAKVLITRDVNVLGVFREPMHGPRVRERYVTMLSTLSLPILQTIEPVFQLRLDVGYEFMYAIRHA